MFYRRKALLFLILFIVLLTAAVYCLLFSTFGSTLVARLAISRYAKTEDVIIEKAEGSLSSQLLFKDVTLEGAAWLPKGASLGIQELIIDLNFFDLQKSSLKVNNASLKLPASARLLFYGSYDNGFLDFNIYSQHINLGELLNEFFRHNKIDKISGVVNDFDLTIKGSPAEPQLAGELYIKELRRKGFLALNCPTVFSLSLKKLQKELELFGEISFANGRLSGNKTAVVSLEPSSIIFSGNPKEPNLNFKGTSYVERVKIDLDLKGTFKSPDLKLSSNPAMPKGKLLIMLATGRMWAGADTAFQNGGLPVGLAADFLDYFIFSGSGSQLAGKLGLKDFSFNVDSSSRGLSLKKELNRRTDILYGAEQPNSKDSKSQARQKVGVGYKLTENISLDAEREIKQNNKNDNEGDESKEESKVKVQFKKEF